MLAWYDYVVVQGLEVRDGFMPALFQRVYPPAQPPEGPAYLLPLLNGTPVLLECEDGVTLLRADESDVLLPATHSVYYVGMLDGLPMMAYELLSESELPVGWRGVDLRTLLTLLDGDRYTAISWAVQIVSWLRDSRYCPRCAHPREMVEGTWGRRCPACGYIGYPPVSPAILVLVHDGEDQVLLAHKPGWGKRYSCIAGFAEPAESLEQCVQREVYEEVGVEVTDISYVGSQSWPFPHQLMVGFTARYVGGTVKIDQQELDDAVWYHIDDLPTLPSAHSLAHHIIMSWVEARRYSPTREPRGARE